MVQENDDFMDDFRSDPTLKARFSLKANPSKKEAPQKSLLMDYTQVPEGRHVFPGLSVQENL